MKGGSHSLSKNGSAQKAAGRGAGFCDHHGRIRLTAWNIMTCLGVRCQVTLMRELLRNDIGKLLVDDHFSTKDSKAVNCESVCAHLLPYGDSEYICHIIMYIIC